MGAENGPQACRAPSRKTRSQEPGSRNNALDNRDRNIRSRFWPTQTRLNELPYQSLYCTQGSIMMTSQQQLQLLARKKARRAANNNYLKLSKTLYEKLSKLCREYDTDIYFLAHRNGRFNGFMSKDKTGQPWLPPDQNTLVGCLPLQPP